MRAYFPFTFIVENNKYCCIWYSDDPDGFVMEENKVKCFENMSALISFVISNNLHISEETSVLFVDGFKHWLIDQSEVDCAEFLMFWNVITDLAYSSENLFYGDSNQKNINAVYDKLFIGSQLPSIQEGSEFYVPSWDAEERIELNKVIEDGLRIIDLSLVLTIRTHLK